MTTTTREALERRLEEANVWLDDGTTLTPYLDADVLLSVARDALTYVGEVERERDANRAECQRTCFGAEVNGHREWVRAERLASAEARLSEVAEEATDARQVLREALGPGIHGPIPDLAVALRDERDALRSRLAAAEQALADHDGCVADMHRMLQEEDARAEAAEQREAALREQIEAAWRDGWQEGHAAGASTASAHEWGTTYRPDIDRDWLESETFRALASRTPGETE